MAAHAGANNVHTRKIAEFVSGLTYEQIPGRGPRADKAAHSRFARLRHLRRQPRMVPHFTHHARSARCNAHDLDLGHRPKAVFAACGAAQRHPGARIRARRRAPQGRAPCRRGDAAGADCRRREPRATVRPRSPHRRRRRLRDRAARRPVHGPGAYRPGLAFRRHGRDFLGRGRRGARARARCREDRARARHRRHPIVRPDGGAIRRHGQAHACRPRRAERALWRAAGEGRLYRHRRRVRGALWRLLHHVLALERPLQSRRAERRPRRALRDACAFR